MDRFFFFFFFLIYFICLFIYLFIFGCAGSSVRARAFSSCGKWGPRFITVRGPLFIAVRGPFTIAAPPVAGHRLQTRRLSNCGSRAQPLRGMWDLPRPGPEPVSPALAGRFSTTAPPGKPGGQVFVWAWVSLLWDKCQAEGFGDFWFVRIIGNINMLPLLEANACHAHTNQRRNVKSYPHLGVYFYINRVLNLETRQHLCSIYHMPGCILGLLCVLTRLSS